MSNQLIYAMSTKGSLKIDEFNEIFTMVYSLSSIGDEVIADINMRLQVIRTLDSLGYCEFDFDKRMVYMCKPSLILLPTFGLPKAVLVGARTPALAKKLRRAVEKRQDKALLVSLVQGRTNINIPPLPCIEAIDIDILKEIATETAISCDVEEPIAWRLANFSSSLDEIKRSLLFEERVEPNWKQRVFMSHRLMFLSESKEMKTDNILVEYRNPVDKQLMHWFWNGTCAAEVERDWGRYLALASIDLNVLLYDEKLYKLIVPVTVPLPCLIARSIVLCEGKVPVIAKTGLKKLGSIPPGHPVHIYSGVTPAIAELISKKLGQEITFASFIIGKDGVLYA